MKDLKFWKISSDISTTSRSVLSAVVNVNDGPDLRLSDDAIDKINYQLLNLSTIERMSSNWTLVGDEKAIGDAFQRKQSNGKLKVLRLHNTESNVFDTIEETLINLMDIALYRSSLDAESRKRITSPMHELHDGFFCLGYDIVIIPTVVPATILGPPRYELVAIVNPVSNYDYWTDIAVVGSYHQHDELSSIIDWLVKRLVFEYGSDHLVCDHHVDDPGSFGFKTIKPTPVRNFSSALIKIGNGIKSVLDWTDFGFALSAYDSVMSSNEIVIDGSKLIDQIKKQHDIAGTHISSSFTGDPFEHGKLYSYDHSFMKENDNSKDSTTHGSHNQMESASQSDVAIYVGGMRKSTDNTTSFVGGDIPEVEIVGRSGSSIDDIISINRQLDLAEKC